MYYQGKKQVRIMRYRYSYEGMAEVAEPKVKPAETEAPAKDPKFNDFMKAVLDNEPELPKQYACILNNDRSTDAFLVVRALMEGFGFDEDKAMRLMMTVHKGDRGLIAVYAKDEAQTRATKAMAICHERGYTDFRITVEEER